MADSDIQEPSSVAWTLLWPIRFYVRHTPFRKGRGVLIRNFLAPCLPKDKLFIYEQAGVRYLLSYDEIIGQRVLFFSDFEAAEIAALRRLVRPGTSVFDVGANVGFFAAALAAATDADQHVYACEPVASNVARLRRTVALNHQSNVVVYPCAVGAFEGHISLNVGADPAYVAMADGNNPGDRVVTVQQRTLDAIWSEAGKPRVSVVKIDVEGGEADVLSGCRDLIERNKPALLIEANDSVALRVLNDALSPYGYSGTQPPGFQPWNYLFVLDGPEP